MLVTEITVGSPTLSSCISSDIAPGYGYSIDRVPQPERVIFTLYDYRERYATYRTDLDLLASHQQFPWIPVWDDHGTL